MIKPSAIESLTSFQRNAKAFVSKLQKGKEPLVLTVNGRAALVVQDAEAYEALLAEVEIARASRAKKRDRSGWEIAIHSSREEADDYAREQMKRFSMAERIGMIDELRRRSHGPLPRLERLVESLIANEVEFIVVGAYAVTAYTEPRYTSDIDFFIRAREENIRRLRQALDEFGLEAVKFDSKDMLDPKKMLTLGATPHRVDIMNSISGVEFEDAWRDRVIVSASGLQFPILSYEHLKRNKAASGRPKDLVDMDQLEAFGDPNKR